MTIFERPARARAHLLCSVVLLGPCVPAASYAQDYMLGTIVVGQEEAEGLTEAATSISAEDIRVTSGGDVVDAIRSTPGAFTRSPSDNPGLSVNIRGMQGLGRVNTMIEGVPQTFRNLSGHAGTFDDQVFVDPSLLVGADISRGAVPGADGLGALSGAANLRLLDVDDILLDGRESGGMVRASTGDNGSHYNALTAGALRREGFSAAFALSGYEQGAFEPGEYDAATDSRAARDAQAKNGLLRVHFTPDESSQIDLLGLWGETDFLANSSSGYSWETEKQLFKGDYHYNPASDLIDLDVSAYLQKDRIYFPGSDAQSGSSFNGRDGTDTGLGFKLSNTSRFDYGADQLELSYGVVLRQNEFDGNAQSGANASGTLKKYGLFFDGTFQTGAFDVGYGLRYDGYELSGVTDATAAGDDDCPADAPGGRCIDATASRSDGEVLSHVSIGYSPLQDLRLYASYAETMRAPTASEMFYPGGHNFSGSVSPGAQNLDLEAEFSDTYELGVSYRRADVFSGSDILTVSANLFRSNVENYVVYGEDPSGNAGGIWYNTDGVTRMQGVELSIDYDSEVFFADLSFTAADTKQPLSEWAGIGSDSGRLPDDFGALNLGVKLLDGDLVLGARVRYVGDSVIAIYDEANSLNLSSYTLLDLYGSYQVAEGLEVFANVANAADKRYYEAGTGVGDSTFLADNPGAGREISFGATWKF